jgi:tetratricopeptide (TPR) repeat protein
VLRTERKYVAALTCLQRALRRQSEALGVHPATAQTHTRLGALWFEQQRYTTARFHFQEALAIREATLGPRDPATAQSLHNLGVTLAALGDLWSARVCLAQALAIREDRLGRTHLATAQSLEALSRVLADLGDDESAQYCLERAAALYRQRSGDGHPASAAVAVQVSHWRCGGARWMNLLRREP